MAATGLVALVALRTVEDYFIICTMGMGVIRFSAMNNWMELTHCPDAESAPAADQITRACLT